MNAEYPQFYRKGGLCMKRESDTTTLDVIIPEPGKYRPNCLPETTAYPSKERLDAEVSRMEKVDEDVYESYLATYFQTAAEGRAKLNHRRQHRFEKGVMAR